MNCFRDVNSRHSVPYRLKNYHSGITKIKAFDLGALSMFQWWLGSQLAMCFSSHAAAIKFKV